MNSNNKTSRNSLGSASGKMPNFKRSGTYVIEKSPTNINDQYSTNLTRPKVDAPTPPPPPTNQSIQSSKPKLSRIPSLTRKNDPVTQPPPSSANSQKSTTSSIETISLVSTNNNNKNVQETPATVNVTRKTNLALIKEQKRAELKKTTEPPPPPPLANTTTLPLLPLPRNIELILKNARKTGQLNLSDFGLVDVPSQVWHLNTQDIGISKSTLIENSSGGSNPGNELKWWEQVDLNKLIMASNKIKIMPKDVQNLNSLVTLDVNICF